MDFNPFRQFKKSPKSSLEPTRSRKEDPLTLGREVKVKRSGAEGLEDGFKITAFDHEKKLVVVQKPLEGGKVTIKKIPILELEELNPPRS